MCSDRILHTAVAGALLLACGRPADARILLSVDEALQLAFPDARITRESVFLTESELAAATRDAVEPVTRALVVRYVAHRDGSLAGTAYLDTHRVRTVEETLLIVVDPAGALERVEVLSFDEPPDYLPREAWYRQFGGIALDENLRTGRKIRAVSGATLTATATTAAARRVLAVHAAIARREPAP